jgi:hypothetical protein
MDDGDVFVRVSRFSPQLVVSGAGWVQPAVQESGDSWHDEPGHDRDGDGGGDGESGDEAKVVDQWSEGDAVLARRHGLRAEHFDAEVAGEPGGGGDDPLQELFVERFVSGLDPADDRLS